MFDLTEAHIRRIVFAMENQKTEYVVETVTGTVRRRDRIPEDELPSPDHLSPEDAYLDILPWSSMDGFQMMTAFTSTVQDPDIRKELQKILSETSGVFRRFREVLHTQSVLLSRWNSFKFNTMRVRIIDWYNTTREVFGLDAYEVGVDEEIDDLAHQSFSIDLTDLPPETVLREIDESAYCEARPGVPLPILQTMYRQSRNRLPPLSDVRSAVFIATTPIEDMGGFLWAVRETLADGSQILSVEQLFVMPKYRGMGIGSSLVDSCVQHARRQGSERILMRAGSACDQMRHKFTEYGVLIVEKTITLGPILGPA